MVKVLVILTARPSWAKLEPVCRALKARPDVELQIITCASALVERYGKVEKILEHQGYTVTDRVYSTLEADTGESAASETGHLIIGLAAAVRRLRPDVALVCADRHEVLGAAQAVAYQHVRLAHLQGGERSGSIDDKIRDSITALADLHFPSTELAAFRVYSLTGRSDRIHRTGCPSIDSARAAAGAEPVTSAELGGSGPELDLGQPFLVILQHPDTRTAADAEYEMIETLAGCAQVNIPRIVFWPGQDAGMAGSSKAIRTWKERHPTQIWRTVRNLPPNRFLKLLTQAAVLIGNSSAGIRESSYLGVPVVNVGHRQYGRERARNVMDVPYVRESIQDAIQEQLSHGRYPSSTLYGSGDAGTKIAEILAHVSARIYSSPVRI
jgi:UDP-hydrolysing UDP-N-acetyl-D-glucosamine 2-epimerase